jgi:predicted Zn-dependent peptidase
VVLGQPVSGVESASFSFLFPGGSAVLPDNACGAAAVLNDWLFRGAGPYNSRQLIDALDGLGLHRESGAASEHLSYSCSMEAGNLIRALELYAEILLRPRLEENQFEPSRQLALQDLAALDDDPRQKVSFELYEQFYPDPLGRPPVGKEQDLRRLTPDQTKHLRTTLLDWSQAILAVAGKMDFDAVCRSVEDRFSKAPAAENPAPVFRPASGGYRHIPNEGAQVHIGFMTEVPPFGSSLYYQILAAVSVLAGGMSSRLFTEVREKRGLCYAVGARYHSLRKAAGISGYAGTTPDKANQTLEVTLGEFRRLLRGVTRDELDRAKVGLKSTLIMQNESTSARAGRIASDRFYLNRVRPLEEIRDAIESLTVNSVHEFLAGRWFENFTIVSIGPKPLEI